MRRATIILGLLLVLITVDTDNINEAANKNRTRERPECAWPMSRVQAIPPLPVFLSYRTPWDRMVVMPEEQTLVVGELLVPCFSETGPPDFKLLPPTPAFVQVVPFACTCLNQAKAYVVLSPRLGDRGKYSVVLAGAGCGGVADGSNQDSFTVKVKKATQD